MAAQTRRVVAHGAQLLRWGLCIGTLLCFSPALAEEGPASEDAAESRAESFRAVEGAVQEDIAGGPLMLLAYAVTWVGVFLYVIRLSSLQQRTLKEVERLSEALQGAKGRVGE